MSSKGKNKTSQTLISENNVVLSQPITDARQLSKLRFHIQDIIQSVLNALDPDVNVFTDADVLIVADSMTKAVYDTQDRGIVDASSARIVTTFKASPGTLNPGEAVFVTVGGSELADNTFLTGRSDGIALDPITDVTPGRVLVNGIYGGDTSAWAPLDILWLGPVPGLLTNVPPVAGEKNQLIGLVLTSDPLIGLMQINPSNVRNTDADFSIYNPGANVIITATDVQAAIDAENELRLLKRKNPMTEKEKKELREKVMEQGKISVYEDDAILKTLGVFDIGPKAMMDLNDAYMLYKDGEYEDKYGNKNYLLNRDREGLGYIVLGKFFTVTGLAPKDVGDISRYGMKEIKKKSISEKQYEKYQEVKKDLKRNPTEAEEYLIVNSRRKAKDITDDINRINKYFEGLTLDQMKEFVETEKYGLFRGSWAIRNIKEGKTAKELTKERNIPTESKSIFSTKKGE